MTLRTALLTVLVQANLAPVSTHVQVRRDASDAFTPSDLAWFRSPVRSMEVR